ELRNREVNEVYRGKKLRDWMNDLKSGDEFASAKAREVIESISEENVDLVPALQELLKDEDRGVRWWTLHALGKIGPKAKDALPDIERTWQTTDRLILRKGLEVWRKVADMPAPKKDQPK